MTEQTTEDLKRILSKIDGQEGQTERAEAIRQELERRENNLSEQLDTQSGLGDNTPTDDGTS